MVYHDEGTREYWMWCNYQGKGFAFVPILNVAFLLVAFFLSRSLLLPRFLFFHCMFEDLSPEVTNFFFFSFQLTQRQLHLNSNLRSVATGSWGCGELQAGDPQFKVLIQWLAASVANVPSLIYYTCSRESLSKLDTVVRVLHGESPIGIRSLDFEILRKFLIPVFLFSTLFRSKMDGRRAAETHSFLRQKYTQQSHPRQELLPFWQAHWIGKKQLIEGNLKTWKTVLIPNNSKNSSLLFCFTNFYATIISLWTIRVFRFTAEFE